MTTNTTPKDAAALVEEAGTRLLNIMARYEVPLYKIASLQHLIDRLASSAAPALDAARYRWLANRVLACDFGDNDVPGRVIGWRIRHDLPQSAFMYGPSIDAAIDEAMGAATQKDGA